MEKYNSCISVLVSVLSIMAIVMPLIIQWLKVQIGEEKITKYFKNVAIFSCVITAAAGLIIYIFIIVFNPALFEGWNIPQIILGCVAFMVVSAIASQTSYDKVIKQIITLITKEKTE